MNKFALLYNFNYFDYSLFLYLIFFSIFLLTYIKAKIKLSSNIVFFLFLYHNLIFLIYTYYQIIVGSDSMSYFLDSAKYVRTNIQPSNFLYKIASHFVSLNISFHLVNYIFSIISFTPFIFFLKIIEKLKIYERSKIDYFIVISILFFPSFHFWISGFSKDTISFVAIFFSSYLYIAREDSGLPKTSNTLFIALIFFLTFLLYFVRPHLALLIFVSSFVYCLIKIRHSFLTFKYIFVLILALLMLYFLLNAVFGEKLSYRGIVDTLTFFRDLNIEGTKSQIDIETIFIVKFIYYLISPNFFTYSSLTSFDIIVVIENTILIFFFLKLFEFNFSSIKFSVFSLTMVVLFFLSMTVITSNLGISNRQKWMVFLPLITIFLYARFYAKNLKFSK
jgi:hypothetical protein